MSLGNAGQAGERLAGQTAAHTQSLGALAKRGQEQLLPFVRGLGLRKHVGALGRLVPAFACRVARLDWRHGRREWRII